MQLSFIYHREARLPEDRVRANHLCKGRGHVLCMIRAWYRMNNGVWTTYDDESADDVYCPRCGQEYPNPNEIEQQFQAFRTTQFEHEVPGE